MKIVIVIIIIIKISLFFLRKNVRPLIPCNKKPFQSKFISLVDESFRLLHNENIRSSDSQKHLQSSAKYLEWGVLLK